MSAAFNIQYEYLPDLLLIAFEYPLDNSPICTTTLQIFVQNPADSMSAAMDIQSEYSLDLLLTTFRYPVDHLPNGHTCSFK